MGLGPGRAQAAHLRRRAPPLGGFDCACPSPPSTVAGRVPGGQPARADVDGSYAGSVMLLGHEGHRGRRVALAWACSVGLIGMLVPAAAARAVVAPGTPRAVAVGTAPAARLTVSDLSPRQGIGVVFDASTSTSSAPVALYLFDYGDGTSAATYQPLAMHAYRRVGIYNARVGIADTLGRTSVSAVARVVVRDGVAPTVRIDYPRPNLTVHFGRRGPLFSGRASDPSGVRRVELAISLLSVTRAHDPTAPPKCLWYDGVRSLRVRACASPLFFRVRASHGRWTFRVNSRARIPAGVYALRVRAMDAAGNRSSILSPRLRTIVGFRLVA